jgi:DNA (cytosine-5)-methyltransferase 1
MRVLDLFSGIGGFSLGLERAGMRTVAFCEIDPFCRRVLAKHWPDVPVWGDIRTLTNEWVMANTNCGDRRRRSEEGRFSAPIGAGSEPPRIDVIAGGFPCQDISVAGKGAGIAGGRSGLWSEYARVIGEVRPRHVIVENVAALLGRGLATVLGDLAALGFDAEWHCIPASAVGAPHRRDRVWIIANARHRNEPEWPWPAGREGWQRPTERREFGCDGEKQSMADADEPRLEGWLRTVLQECAEQRFAWAGGFQGWDEQRWFAQSGMGRVSNGTANRVDRLRSLGNAVVPQIPEIIGRAIMNSQSSSDG